MATFSKSKFQSLNYESFRPLYPESFYKLLLEYTGKSKLENTLDLGCGTGVATFPLLLISEKVTGLDISQTMIDKANSLKLERTQKFGVTDESRVDFVVAAVEDFEGTPGSYDLIGAAECIHWFKDYDQFFKSAADLLAPGGTLAYWYYVDPVIVDFRGTAKADLLKEQVVKRTDKLYNDLTYDKESLLGPHWEQPGRSILQNALELVDKHIPHDLYKDVKIRKFSPGNPFKDDDMRLEKEMSLRGYTQYLSTFSAFHNFDELTGGGQKLIDDFLATCGSEFGWHPDTTTVTVHWYSGYTFMKKK